MATLFVLHSVLGLRAGEHALAREVTLGGHEVVTPDLFSGESFEKYDDAFAFFAQRGGPAPFFAKAATAADLIEGPIVYSGFSMGGVAAELLAGTRPDAVGLILFNAGISPAHFELATWPSSVSPQLHVSTRDPFGEPDELDAFIESVNTSGALVERCDYDIEGHLFMDETLTNEYNHDASDRAIASVCAYLDAIDLAVDAMEQ